MAKKELAWDSDNLVVKEWNAYVRWVEVVPGTERADIPRLHFVWETKQMVEIPDDVTDEEVLKRFPDAEITVSVGGTDRYIWGSSGHLNHRWFMNFRRYGWAWTSDPNGEYGYNGAVIYANAYDAGIPCSTPEEVVHDTAIAAYHANELGCPKDLLFDAKAQDGLAELVEDAKKNPSEHAWSPIRYRERKGKGVGSVRDLVPPPSK